MAVNIDGLVSGVNSTLSIAGLVLVTPQSTVGYQPQNTPSWKKDTAQPQNPALLFNYEGEQTATLKSDITDHYIENNTAIQDQIALKPVTITTHGFVGELNNVPPAALVPLKQASEKLVALSAYAPAASETAALAYARAFQLYQAGAATINAAVSAWGTLNGTNGTTVINGASSVENGRLVNRATNQTKQQIYFQQFFGFWQSRTLFTVQTPWAIFQDMAIETLVAVQDADTKMITDFQVTFKMMRFAATQVVATGQIYDNANFQGRLNSQGASEENLGVNAMVPDSSTTFASQVA